MKYLVLTTVFLLMIIGCGEPDEVEWSEWINYPDEDSSGEIVEGSTWVHEPTFLADTPRQFRYETSRDVDAFVAPSDACQPANAENNWNDVDEFEIDDYSDRVGGDSGQPICVRFSTDLISDDGMWHVEPFVREAN